MEHSKIIRDYLILKIPHEQRYIETRPEIIFNFLDQKLDEEIEELKNSDYKDLSEYADVIEVLYALANERGIEPHQIETERLKKLNELGGFRYGLILKDIEHK